VNRGGERSEHIARSGTGQPIARGTVVTITVVGGDAVTVAPVNTPVR
jgi:thiamine biosynthesis lipoprotein ApbE